MPLPHPLHAKGRPHLRATNARVRRSGATSPHPLFHPHRRRRGLAQCPHEATDALLQVRGLKKHFPVHRGLLQRQTGWVKAVDGVSFCARPRQNFGASRRERLRQDHHRTDDSPRSRPDRRGDPLSPTGRAGRRYGPTRPPRSRPSSPADADDLPRPVLVPKSAHASARPNRRAAPVLWLVGARQSRARGRADGARRA